MDREKIIAKLEKEVKKTYSIKTTIYNNGKKVKEDITEHREPGVKISMEMANEILAMLKEQEAVEPVRDKAVRDKTGRLWLCGNCGSYVGFEDNDPYDPNEFDKYCRKCGRPVLWGRSVR